MINKSRSSLVANFTYFLSSSIETLNPTKKEFTRFWIFFLFLGIYKGLKVNRTSELTKVHIEKMDKGQTFLTEGLFFYSKTEKSFKELRKISEKDYYPIFTKSIHVKLIPIMTTSKV